MNCDVIIFMGWWMIVVDGLLLMDVIGILVGIGCVFEVVKVSLFCIVMFDIDYLFVFGE